MDQEPRNAASDLTRWAMPRLADRDFRMAFADRVTADFTMDDRRTLVGSGVMDVDRTRWWAEEFHKLGGDVVITVEKVLAVRGKRSTAVEVRYEFPDRGVHSDSILVIRYDRPVWLTERVVQFDADDVDGALAELERLHAEIDSEVPPTA